MRCPQCSRTVSVWRRGLLTGICPPCQVAPSPQVVARLDRLFRYTASAGFLVLVAAVAYCTPLIRAPLTDSQFSTAEWAQGDTHARGRMARDLVASGRLMRTSREYVRAILGTPDVERFGGQTIRFHVDIGYRWVIQPHLYDLVVRFGKGNEVFQVAIEPCEGT